jgi:peptidyl-tRNA hydrolase, PTH1 family
MSVARQSMALFHFFKRLFRTGSPPETADILFFGLGNKGARYASSRHNIGYRIADALALRLKNRKNGIFGEAEYTQGTLFESGKKTLSVKPLTLMNRSGDAVKRYIETCRCPLSCVLVIVDDYNLPLGRMRARRNGSDGGHNGLKSIISRISSEGFPRLRVGIGPLRDDVSSTEFVLGTFTEAEEKELRIVIPRVIDACLFFAEHGIDAAMNKFNS